uniref:Reverse transcriptase Ty1/copia-type domain-containing protein n=1 Tax=Tanacetum cinerariifolium TaxID=118510 RepID=A0A6L2LNY3_TANCI|nr:hypothetical protein [Tanacetum cinerariifolium]
MFERENLSGSNYNDWFRSPKMVLRVKKKLFVIEQPISPTPPADSKQFENSSPYEMLQELKFMFEKQAGVERFDLIHTFHACKYEEGKPVGSYVIKMKNYMHNMGKTIGELHALLIEYENGLPKKAATPHVMAIQEYPAKDDTCDHYKGVGHCKRNCPAYLTELIKKKKQVGTTDMVRFMINLTTLSLSFGDYALETATRILNMVPTKKVDKTPYELWYRKVPNLSYLKVLGCEALVKRGRAVELEDIQDEDTSPSKITSKIPMEVEGFDPPQEEVIPVRRPVRTLQAPERLFFVDPNHPKEVRKLQRSIYGLKRALRSWNKIFDEEIKRFGYSQNLDKPYVYQKASGSNVTFLILYVDDIIIVGNHIPSLQSVKTYLGKCFAMKDLREATFILGIKIYRDRLKRLIGLSQYAYMDEILKVGSIMYAVRCTRTDVAFAQNITSRFQQNPGEPPWTAVKTILKYLKNTKDVFLVYGRNPEAELQVDCYCNAGFETDRDEIKFQTGYVAAFEAPNKVLL